MSAVTIRRITDKSDSAFEGAVTALADAFDKPLYLTIVEGKRENLESNIRANCADAIIEGELVVAELPDLGVIGAATWYGPGKGFLLKEEQKEYGWNQFLASLRPETQEFWHKMKAESRQYADEFYGKGTRQAGYHLQLLGTIPKYHRNGAGRGLIKYGMDKARALKVPALVETIGEPNIGIYKRNGYSEIAGVGKIDVGGGKIIEMSYLMERNGWSAPQSA